MNVRRRWLVKYRGFVSPRGWEAPSEEYRSQFGFIWWFWVPRLHRQPPDQWNPRVIRLIWFCFAVGLEIWGSESRSVWPSDQVQLPKITRQR